MNAKTKIIAVVNQKGGVGKSTLAFHLAHAAAKSGKKVLGIDLDAQGSFSQYLTGDLDVISNAEGGAGALLEGNKFEPMKTTHAKIDLLHAHEHLDKYDNDEETFNRCVSPDMREFLCSLGYDYIIMDTPGYLGFRTIVGLCWTNTAVIPMKLASTNITSFQNVLKMIMNDIEPFNPNLKWFAMFNDVNVRVKSYKQKEADLREQFGKQILPTLATRAAVAEAMEEDPALPVWLRKGVSKELANEWLNLCKKVIAS